MAKTGEIKVLAYANNNPGAGKREPLVHILASSDELGDVQSIAFDPRHAGKIADAIAKAGRAARRGRDTSAIFNLSE